MTAAYDSAPPKDENVSHCIGLLMDTLRKAVNEHEAGAVIDQSYVLDHYAAEISNFATAYSALSETEKSAAQTYILDLPVRLAQLLEVVEYFGVPIDSLG